MNLIMHTASIQLFRDTTFYNLCVDSEQPSSCALVNKMAAASEVAVKRRFERLVV